MLLLVITLAAALVPAGCRREAPPVTSIPRLRIGVLPDQSVTVLRERYEPVRAYLGRTLGVPCELVLATSYEILLEDFCRGDIDLAYLGGFTFVSAQDRVGAIPIVSRAEDRQFVSYLIVPDDGAARSIDDLAGSRLAFGSRLSTSGHLMPRRFIEAQGIDVETFFGEVRYTGAHDATTHAVRNGEADIGCVNARVFDAMLRDGRLAEGEVRVLAETPPYVDYVWAARPDVPTRLRTAILDAFLALEPGREEHRELLACLDARAFYPASPTDFAEIAASARRLGLLLEESPE